MIDVWFPKAGDDAQMDYYSNNTKYRSVNVKVVSNINNVIITNNGYTFLYSKHHGNDYKNFTKDSNDAMVVNSKIRLHGGERVE